LNADQGSQARQFNSKRGRQFFPECEVDKRYTKRYADDTSEYAMAPFHIEYLFEIVKDNGMIEPGNSTVHRHSTWKCINSKRYAHNLNSGVALYFSNSLSQSACESGGRIPVIGRHSVMLSPDSVKRVTPPTTMTANTKVEENKSQRPTAGGDTIGSCATFCGGGGTFAEKNRASSDRAG
jgi:hypothetical protein